MLDVSALPNGDALLEAMAYDAQQTMVARGTAPVTLPPAAGATIAIELRCQSIACAKPTPDGGVDGTSDGNPPVDAANDAPADVGPVPGCGNGRVDNGESCDTAIPPGLPGACPVGCDDHILCTADTRSGTACTVACSYTEITAAIAGDGCCPAGADHATDPDCSSSCGNGHVDPSETCDVAIASGAGACPSPSSCDDGDPCTSSCQWMATPAAPSARTR